LAFVTLQARDHVDPIGSRRRSVHSLLAPRAGRRTGWLAYPLGVNRWFVPVWFVIELFAMLAVLLLCLLTPVANAILAWRARGTRPVLLVHGFGALAGSMLVIGWRLAAAGFRPVAIGWFWLRPPEQASNRIAARAAELATATSPKVDVVAHSMGG